MTNSEVLPPEGTRAAAADLASEILDAARVPPGFRVVVVATDEMGAFVGVRSNTSDTDTAAILWYALNGAERENH